MALSARCTMRPAALFDPTVSPCGWRRRSGGGRRNAAAPLTGWPASNGREDEIRLPARHGLTFNGIAQGLAADLLAEAASRHDPDRSPDRRGRDPRHGSARLARRTWRMHGAASIAGLRCGNGRLRPHPHGHAHRPWRRARISLPAMAGPPGTLSRQRAMRAALAEMDCRPRCA